MPGKKSFSFTRIQLGKAPQRILAIVLFVALSMGMFVQPAQAQTTYVITDGSTVLVHTSSSTDPASVLLEAGISLGEADTITLQDSGDSTEIVIQRAQLVSIYYGDDLMMVGSYGETVAEILARQDIALTALDRIDRAVTDETYDGMVITITRVREETVETDEVVPFETIVYEDATLDDDMEVILTEGCDGAVRTTYQIRYENDEEVARTVVAQEVVSEAVDEVKLCSPNRSLNNHNFHLASSDAIEEPQVQVSTNETALRTQSVSSSGSSSSSNAASTGPAATFNGSTVTTASGETLSVSQVLSCEATAYTCVGYTGTTATGTTARVGAIAVDPRVIPLGSKLYIVTDDGAYLYGYCTAEDTGGAIKGNIVDLYFNTWDECIQFGRRACTVYVLS